MEEKTIQSKIHEKGFDITNNYSYDYGKIRVGVKNLDDAVIDLGSLKKINRFYGDKGNILKILFEQNPKKLREASEFYYNTNGIL